MAVMEVEFAATLITSDPVPFPPPAGTVTFRALQVTPGKVVPQMIATLPVNPPVGVKVIDELPLLPAVTVVVVPLIVNDPPLELEVKVRLKTVCPPRAIGLGSAGPKELTMMK